MKKVLTSAFNVFALRNQKLPQATAFIITGLFLFVCLSLQAQNCKPKKVFKDKMTNTKTLLWGGDLAFKTKLLNGKGRDANLFVSTDKSGEPYLILHFVHSYPESHSDIVEMSFPEETQYQLKTDKEIVTLTVGRDNKSKKKFNGSLYVNNQLVSEISREQLETLSQHPITYYRARTENGETVEGKVTANKGRSIQSQISCFLKKLK